MSWSDGLSFKGWLLVGVDIVLVTLVTWAGFVLSGGDRKSIALTLLLAAGAGTLGWLLGFFASPYSPEESKKFSDLAKAAWAFAGGFLLSKLDPLLTQLFKGGALVTNPVYAGRALIFIVLLIGAAMNAYVIRRYSQPPIPTGGKPTGGG